MNWKKLGKIFDPTNHNLSFEVTQFAQSPQTIVFDNFVRIYFSTRTRDEKGVFLSKIEFVDFDKTFSSIINYSQEQVIAFGELGTFDEHGIFPINPLKKGDEIWAYTCGWSRRVSVPVETSTGLAISKNGGVSFERYATGPVLTSSVKEPYLVGDSFVKIINNEFHMWYIYGSNWIPSTELEPEARVYKIGYAHSLDGINWKKNEGIPIIEDVLNEHECQALPTVEYYNGKYHMYFCYRYATDFRKNPERGYRLGYAWSTDLKTWNRDDKNSGIEFSKEDWDSSMMCYPHIFECDGKLYLLYNGNEFGKQGFGIAVLE